MERFPSVQQESRPGLPAVLGTESQQMPGIAEAWSRRGLDLDGQKTAPGLDHEIHLFTDGRSPIEKFAALESRVAPCHQVGQNQVLQMWTTGFCASCYADEQCPDGWCDRETGKCEFSRQDAPPSGTDGRDPGSPGGSS